MKTRLLKMLVFIFILALLACSAYLFSREAAPEGAVPLKDVVSSCAGDATGDGVNELLVVSGGGTIDTGERCGAELLVCDAPAQTDLGKLGYIPPEKILYRIDLAGIRPMKVQLGDINGDGVCEISVCVYKTTTFHPVLAKRPFFFDLVDGNLIPVWLGSRLSRPFDDYILYDIDGDGIDEIISVERLEDGGRVLAVYDWAGFGFEMRAQSRGFAGGLSFAPDTGGQAAGTGEIRVSLSDNGTGPTAAFRLDGENLIELRD
jgi:hypothetical protein